MLSMPKQKLNKKQQELWDEWFREMDVLEKTNPPVPEGMARLDGPLVPKRRELQKKYLKLIREAADEHS